MDVCYYNTQIREELDDATAYIHRAIRLKKEHAGWATLYLKMGLAELDHASALIKIFEEDYKLLTSKMETIPNYLADVRTTILDMYSEFSSKIKYLQETYESM